MPVSTANRLTQRRADVIAQASAILDAAAQADRDLTDVERTSIDGLTAAIAQADADMEREQVIRAAAVGRAASTGFVTRVHDRAEDEPWGHRTGAAFGEFLLAIHRADTSRGRDVDPRLLAVATGAGENVAADGGYLLSPEITNEISLRMAGGEIRSRVRYGQMAPGRSSTEINLIDETSRATGSRYGAVQAYWLDEGAPITGSRPKFARVRVTPHKLAALGYATDELLQDVSLLQTTMFDAFGQELLFQTEDACWEGTGAGKPLGILKAPALVTVAKETGQDAGTILVENLSKMWARLDAASQANAVWMINQDCGPQLESLALQVGISALEPRFVSYGPDGLMRLHGRPVIAVEYASTLGTVGDIVLVDWSKYLMVDHGRPQEATSMHVAFLTDEMAFRVTYRVDGTPLWRTALTPFKGTNTVSPFVALDTRA